MNIYEIVEKQRADLLKREYDVVKRIVRAYEVAERRVEQSIRLFQAKIKQAKDAGLEPSLAWYYQEARLENVLREIRGHLDEFSQDALEFSTQGRDDAYQLGAVHALRLAEAQVYGDIAGLNAGAFANAQAMLSAASPLKALFDEIGPQAAFKAREVFAQAIAEGWNPRKTGRALANQMEGLAKRRAVLIARTEQIRAYRTANRDVYARNADVLQGWRWTAAKTPATCAMCLALDGEIFPVEETLSSHPACVIGDTKVATPGLLASTARRHSGEVVQIKTRNGHVLTVTPNHPILTPEGYVAAGLLREGGYIVSGTDPEGAMKAIDPDYNNVPTKAEEVARLCRELPGVARRLVPGTAKDFHGDGFEGQVDVVNVYSPFMNEGKPSIPEHIAKDSFGDGARFTETLFACGPLKAPFSGTGLASQGSVSGFGASPTELGRSLGGHEPIGVGPATDIDSSLHQAAADAGTRYSETFGETLLALSGLISADEIVGIELDTFHGWVYNFETATGWYTANGIIVHNCRCSMVPLPKTDFGGPQPQSGEAYFQQLTDAEQNRILGTGKAEMYRDGKMTLKDNVVWRDSPEWGRQPASRPLSVIRERQKAGTLPSQSGPVRLSPFNPTPQRKLSELLDQAERKANDPVVKALDAWEGIAKGQPRVKTGLNNAGVAKYKGRGRGKSVKLADHPSEIQELRLDQLSTGGVFAKADAVRAFIRDLGDGPDLPIVVREGGRYFIHDGDSVARLEAKRLLGQSKASVRLFDADAFSPGL